MTTHAMQASADAPHAESTDRESGLSKPESASAKPGIPAFSFPFSPSAYAADKKNDQPWHQKGNKSNHDQRPGLPPKGSSKSMGKR
ncbi:MULTISPECIES: hypothetical protein [unclassified Pseudomonas]|jgi:hypothetical protein|uniref:hypothetical protein n=1 Tax=unclassified Pseudomonas TaxID=196821 RepID=UPI0023570B44|nr:hypothetical protein [Pseudomonas sp.]